MGFFLPINSMATRDRCLVSTLASSRFFSSFYNWYRWNCPVDFRSLSSWSNGYNRDRCLNLESFKARKRPLCSQHTSNRTPPSQFHPRQHHIRFQQTHQLFGSASRRSDPRYKERIPQQGSSFIRKYSENHALSTSHEEGDMPTAVDFRTIMRYIPQPIVIVTTYADSKAQVRSDRLGSDVSNYRAMTVSSFNTVSMNPPTVSFNIRKPSRTLDAILQTRKFRLLVLKQDDAAAQIARGFSEGPAEDTFSAIQQSGEAVRDEDYGPNFARGVFAELCCTIPHKGSVEVADHVVLFARLDSFRALETPGSTDSSRCLIYSERGFHQLGTRLDEGDSK